MKLDQLFFTRLIFFISFVCLAYIVSEFSQQKDTFNYLESIFKYEEDAMSIFSRVYFFTGMITYLDGLTSLNGVQVMHLIIITIIGIFFTRLINTPLEGIFLLTLAVSPLISDNFRGVIRQGFGFSLLLIGLLTDKKFIRYAFFSAGFFIHNLLILPIAAVLVSFSYQKISSLINLKDSQKPPLFLLFSFISCLFIFMAIYLQIFSATNLSSGIDTAKSGLDFVFFLGFLSLLFIFSGLDKYKWFYETVFFLFIFLTTYFLLTGSARLLMVGMPFIIMFILNIKEPETKYFFLGLFLLHSIIRLFMNPGNFIAI
mgnify:CR=1 FL=1|tara:strand:+ start:2150 stop:3091 length:942 start_codon:yes stop_codon:yes gene_type:complete